MEKKALKTGVCEVTGLGYPKGDLVDPYSLCVAEYSGLIWVHIKTYVVWLALGTCIVCISHASSLPSLGLSTYHNILPPPFFLAVHNKHFIIKIWKVPFKYLCPWYSFLGNEREAYQVAWTPWSAVIWSSVAMTGGHASSSFAKVLFHFILFSWNQVTSLPALLLSCSSPLCRWLKITFWLENQKGGKSLEKHRNDEAKTADMLRQVHTIDSLSIKR